jgi:hypothetical protein
MASCRTRSRSAEVPTKVVRHPRLPQMHSGPAGSMETCPISPATPAAPR